MSYRIEYQWAVFVERALPGCTDGVPRFVVCIEGGDNNLYDSCTGKRSRSWDVSMLGTKEQVLKRAVYFAGSCEGGMLKPNGRDMTPEGYVAKIRRLIDSALVSTPDLGIAYWFPEIRLGVGDPAIAFLQARGMRFAMEKWYGEDVCRAENDREMRHLVFEVLDHFPNIPAWSLARVGGLRSS